MKKGAKIAQQIKKLEEKTKERGRRLKEVWRLPHNNLFVLALIFIIIFLLVELANRIYDLYHTNPWVDIPSHFFAGAALGLLFLWIISLTSIKHKKTATLFFVFIIKMFWELLETLEEQLFYNPPHLQDYFIWDGAFDVAVGLLGASLMLLIIKSIKKRNDFLEEIDI